MTATHLGCVAGSADFLFAFPKFTAHRGTLESSLSEHAASFVLTIRVVDIEDEFIGAQERCKGGVYERLIIINY